MVKGIRLVNYSITEDKLIIQVSIQASRLPRLTVTGEADQTWDANSWIDHTIIVPREALVDRRQGYNLPTYVAALIAIFKEHVKSLNDLPDGTESNNPLINKWGGLRGDIDVTLPPAIASAAENILRNFVEQS